VGQVPRQPPGYQHRTDLLARLTERADAGPYAVVHALTGQRGVGKTHLAAAYARQRIEDRWSLVAWLTAEEHEALITGLAELAEHLGLRTPEDDAAGAAARVRACLEARTEPGLLVIDNAGNPADLRPHLPATGPVHVVVTTTNQAFATTAEAVGVTVYTPEQAVDYLTSRTRLTDTDSAFELAAELGHLPLALAQTSWLISSGGKTYAQALTDVRTTPLADLLRPAEGDSYPRTVAETVLLTAAHAETLDPDAETATVLGVLALLSPAGVPRSLLADLLANLPNPVDKQKADRILAILAQASLIGYSLENTMVLMHRLTQRVLRDRAASTGTLHDLIADLIAALSSQTISDEQAWTRRTEAAALINQITALSEHAIPITDQARTSDTAETGADVDLALLDLRAWAVQHLIDVQNLTQAITIGETLAADAAALFGPDNSDTCYHRESLANAHLYAGHVAQAIDLYKAALADRQRLLGPDDPSTLTTQHNLALAYQTAGRVTEAINLYEPILAAKKRILPPDDPSTLTTQHNLARAYGTTERVAEAIDLFKAVLAAEKRILGPDHPDTLITQYNLAYTFQTVGRVTEAIELYEAVLADQRRVLGPDHPDTLITQHNLAVAYETAGRVTEAIELYEAVLADQRRVLGPDDPDTLDTSKMLEGIRGRAYQHNLLTRIWLNLRRRRHR
jgi:tetratricopeptide (TPR) repeat protein